MSAADGIGRRNSIGMRNALDAKSLEPSRMPIGIASTAAIVSPSAPAAHGVGERPPEVARLHHRPQLVEARAHRRQVALRDDAGARDQLPEDERRRDREDEDERLDAAHAAALARDRQRAGRDLSGRHAPLRPKPMRAEISRAVSTSAGARSSSSSSIETSERCTAMLIAATTSPVCEQHGRSDRAQAVRELLVVHGEPGLRTRSSSLSSCALGRDRVRAAARELHPVEQRVAARRGGRNASSTLPIDVQYAGRREPTCRLRSISRGPRALRQRSM